MVWKWKVVFLVTTETETLRDIPTRVYVCMYMAVSIIINNQSKCNLVIEICKSRKIKITDVTQIVLIWQTEKEKLISPFFNTRLQIQQSNREFNLEPVKFTVSCSYIFDCELVILLGGCQQLVLFSHATVLLDNVLSYWLSAMKI